MDAELKSKWIAALRGGKYEQAHTQLRDCHGKFCCLGVLCVVADIQISPDGFSALKDGRNASYDPIRTVIGDEGDKEDYVSRLYEMNDSEGATFDAIADWIEKNL